MAQNTINNFEEFNNIINNGRVVVIDFHASWSDCSQLSGQQLSNSSETFKRLGVDFYSVNIDEADDVVLEADVRVVPTFMVFKDGNKVGYGEGVDLCNSMRAVTLDAITETHGITYGRATFQVKK
ncbi:thioredoxin-like protein [Butyriboletus roseoflavus]|nr:thioredoxin-like protein [Butyriboletus roseoflavus]